MPGFLPPSFRRKRPALPPVSGDSPDAWAPGDLAERIIEGEWVTLTGDPGDGPAQGEVRAVLEVVLVRNPCTRPIQLLRFARYPNGVYHALAFRKITPRADSQHRREESDRKLPALDWPDAPAPERNPRETVA